MSGAAASGGSRTGVLLVQLGGPTKRAELKPFLYELFVDPEILDIGFAPLRKLVAWLIATTRAPKSAETYEKIGWSPIRAWTERQATLLQSALRRGGGELADAVVEPSMTCSEPFVEGALEKLRAAGVTRLVVLPLYPQYSVTTTRSSFRRVTKALAAMRWAPERRDAPDAWFDEPAFLAAHVARIEEAAKGLPDPDPTKTALVYSAHSLPVKTVEKKNDPYPKQIEATVAALDAALEARLGRRYPSFLGYQSKVGPMAWIGPSTVDVLARVSKSFTQVLMVPVAFVSDHVETLYEIRMLFADEARRLGIPCYVAADGLNDHPEFIAALASIVARTAGGG